MNIRRLAFLVVLIVAGFWLVTTFGIPGVQELPRLAHRDLPRLTHQVPLNHSLDLTEAEAQSSYDNVEQNNISVYKRVLPAVVNITSTAMAYDFFWGAVPQQGQGSGFIVDSHGHILTNFHVIEGGKQVEVTLSNKHKYKAQVVLTDKPHDLALLQIDAPNLTPAVLSNSENLQVGQKVYAIGNPFGLNGTMTTGIISALRSVRGPEGNLIENAIQTDAAINPGNSGGPLLNSHGEVIGINSLIATDPNAQVAVEQSAGIGFAIPINTAKAVLEDFAHYGRIRRPSLGITSLPIGPELAQQMGLAADYGVLIQRVLPGGAAERAGLHGGRQQAYLGNTPIYLGGDLIIAIDGREVTSAQDLSQIMDEHKTGDTVTVTVLRGQRKISVQVRLEELGTQTA
ncbi:MAG TPA: trypsin-like peptidase domain-containing protein [Acidobacteriaceae bacterium]|jgi:S1-C subfamily serine protease|nr:trypsin-like peptidase domain-containing protein [Acidobacteriaceae bacterium]